jgi:hypothetical protein
MPKSASIDVTFGLPTGGEHTERLRINASMLYAKPHGFITRAVQRAAKRGIRLGCCLRIVHRKTAVFLYTLDTTARFAR